MTGKDEPFDAKADDALAAALAADMQADLEALRALVDAAGKMLEGGEGASEASLESFKETVERLRKQLEGKTPPAEDPPT